MLLCKLSAEVSLSLLGKTIKLNTTKKDLGLTLNSHLMMITYDDHIINFISSCMANLCQIYRVKKCFDKHTLILIIQCLVMSKLFNYSSASTNTLSTNIKKLFSNKRTFDHITRVLKDLKWSPAEDKRYSDIYVID